MKYTRQAIFKRQNCTSRQTSSGTALSFRKVISLSEMDDVLWFDWGFLVFPPNEKHCWFNSCQAKYLSRLNSENRAIVYYRSERPAGRRRSEGRLTCSKTKRGTDFSNKDQRKSQSKNAAGLNPCIPQNILPSRQNIVVGFGISW